jgi:hypothetical protein
MQTCGLSLALTWSHRLCLLRVLLCPAATATSFPLSKLTGGGDTAPAFSGWLVYLQLTWEVGLPPSPVEFSSLCHFYKLSHSWLLGMCCLLPSPASLWGISPPHLFGTQGTPPSLLRVFFVVIAYYSVSLFFPGWGSVCPGGYADLAQGCLWEYRVPLSSPCGLHLPKPSGHSRLAAVWEPSWFLHFMWSGNATHGLGCGGVKVLPLLGGFSCKVYLQRLSKILL